MPLPEGEKNLTLYAFVSIQYQSGTDGQTDGQVCHNSIAFGMHRHADARQKLGMKRKKFSIPSGQTVYKLTGGRDYTHSGPIRI